MEDKAPPVGRLICDGINTRLQLLTDTAKGRAVALAQNAQGFLAHEKNNNRLFGMI